MSLEPVVLAVDDEPGILRLLKLELSAQGYRVLTAGNGDEALQLAEAQRPDIVLLDILMPEITGPEVLRKLRERWGGIPVIFLTAKDADQDKVSGLEQGADDYVVKPFSPDELAARIRAVLRRSAGAQDVDRVVQAGDIEIDLNRRLVTRNGELVSLTRTEWLLLQHLAANAGKVLLSAELLTKVWGPEYRDDLQYLRVWVSRLRRKLEVDPSNPQLIQTRQGIGYLLDAEPAPAPVAAAGEQRAAASSTTSRLRLTARRPHAAGVPAWHATIDGALRRVSAAGPLRGGYHVSPAGEPLCRLPHRARAGTLSSGSGLGTRRHP